MTQMMDCSEARISLGVYVLGAIDPAERAMVDHHLAVCRDCRDELAGLASLPALLARVDPAEAVALAASDYRPAWEEEALAPPDRLIGRVIDLTAARHRRRRWREGMLGVAAAFVIAAGVFAGLRVAASPAPAQPSATSPYGSPDGPWQLAAGQSHGMALTVKYRQMSWGTFVTANVDGIPAGTTCQMWVVGPGKSRMLIGSWTVHSSDSGVWYPASAAISAESVEKFVVSIGKGQSITADS